MSGSATTAPQGTATATTRGIDVASHKAAALLQAPGAQKAHFLGLVSADLGSPIVSVYKNSVKIYQDTSPSALTVSGDTLVLPVVLDEPPEINLSSGGGQCICRLQNAADANVYVEAPIVVAESLDSDRKVAFTFKLWCPESLGGLAYSATFTLDMANVTFVAKDGTMNAATEVNNELDWGYQTVVNLGAGVFPKDNTFRGIDDSNLAPAALNFTPLERLPAGAGIRMNMREASTTEIEYLNKAPRTGTIPPGGSISINVNGYLHKAKYCYVEVNNVRSNNFTLDTTGEGAQVTITGNPGETYYCQARYVTWFASAFTLRHTHIQKYGRFRIKYYLVDPIAGLWFGNWLLPANFDPASRSNSPPEIDGCEVGFPEAGSTPQVHFATHSPDETARGLYDSNNTKAGSGFRDCGPLTTEQICETDWEYDTIKFSHTKPGGELETWEQPNVRPRAGHYEDMALVFSTEISNGENFFMKATDASIEGATNPRSMAVVITAIEIEQCPTQLTEGPVVTAAPVISGTNGTGNTWTATPATMTGVKAGASIEYQWYSGNFPVGSGGLTYVQQAADDGQNLWCRARAIDANDKETVSWSNGMYL